MASSSQSASILDRLQNILKSQVTWTELNSEQQDLFDNLNFNLKLNTSSPQHTYQLLQVSPDLLSLLQDIIITPPPNTPTTVPLAIITANLLDESTPSSSPKTKPKTTADWVKMAIKNKKYLEQETSRLSPQIEEQLQQAITHATPKQNQLLPQTQKTFQTLISTIDTSLDTNLSSSQIKQVYHLAKNIVISSALQNNTISPLVAITTAIDIIKNPQKTDPTKITRQVNRLNSSLQQTPSLLDQIDSSKKEITRFVHAVSTQKETLDIVKNLHTNITSSEIDKVKKLYHQTVPREQQKDFAPFTSQKGEEIASAIEVFDQNAATITRAYNQGLTSQDIDLIIEQPTSRITPSQHQTLLLVKSQLINLEQSSPSPDIQFTPPSKITSFISRSPLGRLINHLPSNRFTRTLNVILHPRSAIKSYIGHRIGKHLAVSFYKKFAKHVTNKSARFVAKSVLRGGLKKGLDTAGKILLKKGVTWLASKGIILGTEALIGVSTGGIGFIVIEAGKLAIKFFGKVIKKSFENLQSTAVSLWGEKIKLKDMIAAPTMIFAGVAAGFTAAITTTATAMAAAATSAGTTIAISAAIAGLLYLTAFTAAPLISTIAQLEGSSPLYSGVIGDYEGPIIDGCHPIWPTKGGRVTQGPLGTYSHTYAEAIDIGVGVGTPVYSVSNGTVSFDGWGKSYGNMIDISSSVNGKNYSVRYAHLSAIKYHSGQKVSVGDGIALSGATSSVVAFRQPHLHFEYLGLKYGECPAAGIQVPYGCSGTDEDEPNRCEINGSLIYGP